MASNNEVMIETIASQTPAFRLRWDVFLSFRGGDTREGFTTSLYEALKEQGVRAFLDNDGLGRGDQIAPTLLEAIDDSAAAVVIFSRNYADSRWCLDELDKICRCRRAKLVLPVFYKVEPSDVRRQRGPFEAHFRAHEETFGEDDDRVRRWREALEIVGGLAGWVLTDNTREESELIKSLVKKVLAKIRTTPIGLAEYTVGLDSRVKTLTNLLDIKSNGVRVLGLHGAGGIGKTTLATALFNSLVPHFEFRSFIPSVRETSSSSENDDDNNIGLVSLQNKLIADLSGGRPPAEDINAGISVLNATVNDKKVLVVLDDVDSLKQMEFLVPKREWLHHGTRIIVTARNREVFRLDHETELFEIRELNKDESLELFSFHALRRPNPPENLFQLSQEIVSLTGGLPLALEVFGSFLFGKRRVKDWEDSVKKLSQIRPRNLQDVLRLSFDGLEDEREKSVFLDIACLLVQMSMKREDVIDVLRGCEFPAETALVDLVQKSLLKVREDGIVWMHDQVRDMGRQIVLEENVSYPGLRSRAWDRKEIVNSIFADEKGEKSIEGMVLDIKRKRLANPSAATIPWTDFRRKLSSMATHIIRRVKEFFEKQPEEEGDIVVPINAIKKMTKLRLLQINHAGLRGKFDSLPSELKWLQWRCCPLKSLPYDFHAPQLAVLDLSESKIQSLWHFNYKIVYWIFLLFGKKVAENLVILNLSECHFMTSIPDLSVHKRLEKLNLERCSGLTHIHDSIGNNMKSLIYLNLEGCYSLIDLPKDVSGLKRLEKLNLSGCSKLRKLPENLGDMESLKELLLDRTAIAMLPDSIFRLSRLEELSLNHCLVLKRLPRCIVKLRSLKLLSLNGSGLEEIPDDIGSLESLEKFHVMWCSSLTVLPDSIKDLKSLEDFSILSSPIKELPESLGSLPNLKMLCMGRGDFLTRLPSSIGGLLSLVALEIEGTEIESLPREIGSMKSLERLELRRCKSLRSLPESIGDLMNLTVLIISGAGITKLPGSVSNLESLEMLRLAKCRELRELPDKIGKLKSLNDFSIEDTGVKILPESFGELSGLIFLRMSKKDLIGENIALQLQTSFSKLTLLSKLYARYCNIVGSIPEDFEKLSSLEILDLGYNRFRRLPSSLEGLSILKKLMLPRCEELESLPPLPSSLLEIDVSNCVSLETVSDLSRLESLNLLNMTSCEKVVDIPGIERLKSLRWLYMSDCNACSSAVKKRLTKESLRNIRNLSMPGSKIPRWFSGEDTVTFSKRKNHAIKAAIICVVVSINHQIESKFRNETPTISEVEASLLTLENSPRYSPLLYLLGVPRTDQDQFHLCRYSIHSPLVSLLEDGYRIRVKRKDPPLIDDGVELKKCGIHLVYEGDDDYKGDEQSLDESQQSISEKLASFFEAYDEDE